MSSNSSHDARRISVVLVCAGQLEYTRLCVHSLLQHGQAAAEILVIDLASLDGTREFLQGVAIASPLNLRVMRVGDDWTYARAYALGASRAIGEYIALVSNDAIVTRGWLQQLAALADFEAELGMVGAMSNGAPTPQNAGPVSYELKPATIREGIFLEGVYPDAIRASLLELASFAGRWREQHRNQWFEVETLATFCCLMKRAVFEKIGGTFPEAPLGIAEVELSRSVRSAGYRIACCQDLFIHHSATRTPVRRP
jgi:GT2 family glycosyltransferase